MKVMWDIGANNTKICISIKESCRFRKLKDNRNSVILPTGSTGSSSIRLSQLYKDNLFH